MKLGRVKIVIKSNMLKLVQIPGQLLTALALWPLKKPSTVDRLRTFLTFLIIILLTICLTINALYCMNDFLQLSKSLYMLISVSLTVIKITVLSWKKNTLIAILEFLNTPNFVNYLPKYGHYLKRSYKEFKILAQIYLGFLAVFVILMCVFPSLGGKRLPLDFPFFNYGLFYLPFYAFEVLGIGFAGVANLSIDILAIVLIIISIIQLNILNNKLIDTDTNICITVPEGDKKIEQYAVKYLSNCCIHFSDIESFTTLTEKFTSIIIFFQLGASVVAICNSCIIILSVEAFSTESIAILVYLCCMVSQLGMYCYFGNEVYLQSLEIHQSCYFSKWYDREPAVKKILFILMERTKRPLQIRGCNFVDLSATTFVSILKWSYSYFTLLRNTMQELN